MRGRISWQTPAGPSAQGSSIFWLKGESFCGGSNTTALHLLRQNAANACRVATRREKLELVTSMAEVALSEREDLGELDREDENRIWEDLVLIVVVKGAVAYEILPSSVPPGGPHPGELFEPVMIGDPDGLALDHHVEPFLPTVAASRQNHVRVPPQVDDLLLSVGRAEVDGSIVPDGNDGCDMRPTIGPHRREPKELGGFEYATRLLPRRDHSVRFAVSRVECRDGFVHHKNSFQSFRFSQQEGRMYHGNCLQG